MSEVPVELRSFLSFFLNNIQKTMMKQMRRGTPSPIPRPMPTLAELERPSSPLPAGEAVTTLVTPVGLPAPVCVVELIGEEVPVVPAPLELEETVGSNVTGVIVVFAGQAYSGLVGDDSGAWSTP